MKRMQSVAGAVIVLTGGWILLTLGNAADPQNPANREEIARDISSPVAVPPGENDRRIARWLAIDNRIVLECAKLARERAVSSDIKNLAEKLVQEHEHCASTLDSVINARPEVSGSARTDGETDQLNADGTPKLQDRTPNRERTAKLIEDAGTSRDNRLLYQPTDFLAVKESVANDLKSIADKEWDGVSGEDFDRAFVKHQIFAHEMLLSTIQAVRGNASAELQDSLDKQSDRISEHLKAIRNLDGKSSDRKEVTESEAN